MSRTHVANGFDNEMPPRVLQDPREIHALCQRIMDNTGDGVFIYDKEGRLLLANTACAECFSVPESQVAGRMVEEFLPSHLASSIREQNEFVMRTGRTIKYEIVLDAHFGGRTLQVQKWIYRNHRGETVGVIGIFRDITERKQAELKVAYSERRFRALIENSADCILLLSGSGAILYASPVAQQISGYDAGELTGTEMRFWVHPDDLARAKKEFDDLLEMPEASLTFECRILCKRGGWKWVENTLTNLLQDESVQAIVLNAHDISERKEAEQVSRRFEAIVESSIDGIVSLDLEGNIMSWNPAARRIFGYRGKEAQGKNFEFLLAKTHRAGAERFFNAMRRRQAVKEFETVCTGKNGEPITTALSLSPIYCRDGSAIGSAVIVHDITDRCRLEKEVLEIAEMEKHRIGQDLHDDLCQHLVGIAMTANLLHGELACQGHNQAAEARQIGEMLRTAADHARALARGLSPLDMAQGGLMAGLETLVAATEQRFRIPCSFECAEAIHMSDLDVATHVFRIAQEALHNAVKHSGGTRAHVRLESKDKGLQISVCDDGVGCSPPDKNAPGGGMGMRIMHYRARAIGAALEIQETPGGGTSVVCRLPDSQGRHLDKGKKS